MIYLLWKTFVVMTCGCCGKIETDSSVVEQRIVSKKASRARDEMKELGVTTTMELELKRRWVTVRSAHKETQGDHHAHGHGDNLL